MKRWLLVTWHRQVKSFICGLFEFLSLRLGMAVHLRFHFILHVSLSTGANVLEENLLRFLICGGYKNDLAESY